ncbi:MAG TPA: DUF998 domain-containing protein [Actinospica sp.]|nr:DUF998 domain-containing protein [Actinospica sp.]
MTFVPRWVLLSSGCAPLVLIGGWALSAALQPPTYSAMLDSISALAAHGAAYPWLMTGALYVLGVCHVVTALGLRVAAMPGRVVLAGGGVASVAVALSPEPTGGTSLRHLVTTGIGFTLLALFPTLAAWRNASPVWALRRETGYAVTGLMAAGAAWFLVELHGHGAAGLAERILTGAQSVWPLIIVVACVTVPLSRPALRDRPAPLLDVRSTHAAPRSAGQGDRRPRS